MGAGKPVFYCRLETDLRPVLLFFAFRLHSADLFSSGSLSTEKNVVSQHYFLNLVLSLQWVEQLSALKVFMQNLSITKTLKLIRKNHNNNNKYFLKMTLHGIF